MDLTFEQLCTEFRHLSKTAKKYVEDHKKTNDTSSLKQAAFALGKASGVYHVLMLSNCPLPQDIVADCEEFTESWWSLGLQRTIYRYLT